MPFNLSLAGHTDPPSTFEYTWKDTVLYALGVGAKSGELDYLYEGRGPRVLPSFAVVPKLRPMMLLLEKTGGDFARMVHEGERVAVHAPLAAGGTLSTTVTLRGFYDLRRLTQVLVDTRTEDQTGRLLAETTSSIIFRGEGGFGGEPPPKRRVPVERPRDVEPTFSVEEATSPEQALLYRLSGDPNPLHADPAFAREAGFERGPILHGLCTFGFTGRALLHTLCGSDPGRFLSMSARFSKPVFPGQDLTVNMWILEDGKAVYRTATDSGVVIDSGQFGFA
jgi:acyl dehydratase